MKKVTLKLQDNRSYDIIIKKDGIQSFEKVSEYFSGYSNYLLVSNTTVWKLYGKQITKSLKKIGIALNTCIIPDGEEYKNIKYFEKILGACIKHGLDRKSLIITFGGGVIGDLAGYVAASYMRGIKFIHIPTTLLAQVDSSVGGKVGINHKKGKNMIGAFYQPELVYIDTNLLKTLKKQDFLSGLAEVVKYGVILDERFFNFLERNVSNILSFDENTIEHIVFQSCRYKSEVVSCDEKESGLRAILNYGHTIGHAIETAGNYKKYSHGYAVAIGMVYASKLAFKKGLIEENVLSRQIELLERFGLPCSIKRINIDKIIKLMKSDKKFKSGKPCFILPVKIGQVIISEELTFKEIEKIL